MKNNTGNNRKDDAIFQSSDAGMSRRDAVKLTAVTIAGTGLGGILLSEAELNLTDGHMSNEKMEGSASVKNVRYEEMFPAELEVILREYPVAYVPFGSLE